MGIPILFGAFWVILGIAVLSVLCFREYARATGLFREKYICYLVVLGIVLVQLAVLDNWYLLFVALFPLSIPARVLLGALIALAAQLGDLMLAAIKRDAGVTDLDVIIPGHGGLLDRFDSMILVAPVAFHVVDYYAGVGTVQPVCVFTGAR